MRITWIPSSDDGVLWKAFNFDGLPGDMYLGVIQKVSSKHYVAAYKRGPIHWAMTMHEGASWLRHIIASKRR